MREQVYVKFAEALYGTRTSRRNGRDITKRAFDWNTTPLEAIRGLISRNKGVAALGGLALGGLGLYGLGSSISGDEKKSNIRRIIEAILGSAALYGGYKLMSPYVRQGIVNAQASEAKARKNNGTTATQSVPVQVSNGTGATATALAPEKSKKFNPTTAAMVRTGANMFPVVGPLIGKLLTPEIIDTFGSRTHSVFTQKQQELEKPKPL